MCVFSKAMILYIQILNYLIKKLGAQWKIIKNLKLYLAKIF